MVEFKSIPMYQIRSTERRAKKFRQEFCPNFFPQTICPFGQNSCCRTPAPCARFGDSTPLHEAHAGLDGAGSRRGREHDPEYRYPAASRFRGGALYTHPAAYASCSSRAPYGRRRKHWMADSSTRLKVTVRFLCARRWVRVTTSGSVRSTLNEWRVFPCLNLRPRRFASAMLVLGPPLGCR